jgi:hypothetical protein
LRNKALWAGPPFQGKPPMTADDIGDLFVWITLGVIIGGRLGFVLFYGGAAIAVCGPARRTRLLGLPGAYLDNPIRSSPPGKVACRSTAASSGVVIGVLLVLPEPQAEPACCRRLWSPRRRRSASFSVASPTSSIASLWGKVTNVPWA